MATTYADLVGNGQASRSFSFPSIKEADIKVEVDNVTYENRGITGASSGATTFTITSYTTTGGGNIVFDTAPANSANKIRIYRDTDVDTAKATFTAGSSVKAGDLNNNMTQILYAAQEEQDQTILTSDIKDAAITSAKIKDDTIVNADVNASAAIAGTKVSPDFGSQNIATTGTINSVTTTELAILDGATVTTAELNKLDGVTASTTELNILDGVTSTTTELNILDGVTASTAEINKLDGVTASTAELNLVDGLTASTTELNKLDGVTASTAELNLLDGVTSTTTELNILDGVTASATEINKLDGVTANTAELNLLDGVTATTAELNLNDGQTATPTEVNILDGATVTTAELNKLDGYTGSTADLNEVVSGKNVVETITGSATDAQIPTAQAVNERVVELVTEVGGFHPIANETSFPTTNPDINDGAGTIVSIKALSSAFTTGSGVTTHTFTNGAGSGNNVTITGLTASTTYPAGRGMLLETTTTSGNGSANPPRAYTYHRLTLDEAGVANAQAVVDDFDERYYGPLGSAPSTRPGGGSRVQGDLYFSTVDNQMKVWNNAASQWDDVASSASSNIITLSPSFDGSETEFTCSTVPVDAQSLLLSINGVIQKPNAGTSTPSEGYVKLANGKIKLAAAPASGSDYFAVALGNVVSVGTPSPDTVGATELKDGEIANVHVSSSAAIARTKLANVDLVDDTTPQLGGDLDTNSHHILLDDNHSIKLGDGADAQLYHSGAHQYFLNTTGNMYFQPKSGEYAFCCYPDGKVELYYDNSVKLETASSGVYINGHIDLDDGNAIKLGSGDDLQIYHDGTTNWFWSGGGHPTIHESSGSWTVRSVANENYIVATENGSVALYYDNSKKFETTSSGATVTGDFFLDNPDHAGKDILFDSSLKTLKFEDGVAAKFGSGSDLSIYHDGSHSYIKESGTGSLIIDTSRFSLLNAADNEYMITATEDGSVELYHNAIKKLETHSNGAKVTGVASVGMDPDSAHSSTYVVQGAASTQCLFVAFRTEDGTNLSSNGMLMGLDNNYHYLLGRENRPLRIGANSTLSTEIDTSGHLRPTANNTYNLGSSSLRWANVYTNDLNLSNEGGANDVDGSWGNWTIQEGESDLFLRNNRSGKKYKFNLTEVS